MVLFAYASNMNLKEFAENIPSVKKLANVYLPGYEFCFNKKGNDLSAKANVQPSANAASKAWGVLIQFDGEHARYFHEKEHFDLKPMKCLDADAKMYDALVFVSKPHAVNEYLLPFDWYKQKIITFAKLQELPPEYIGRLESMEAKRDPNTKRKERRLAKMNKYL